MKTKKELADELVSKAEQCEANGFPNEAIVLFTLAGAILGGTTGFLATEVKKLSKIMLSEMEQRINN